MTEPSAVADDSTLTAEGARDLPTARRIGTGDRLGRYCLEQRIGAGAMGVVFRARDPELDRMVAIKVLRADAVAERADASDHQRRLLREAKALAKLAHPNVVGVFDVGAVGDDLFVAMELIEGCDLRQWLRECPRAWTEVLDRFIPVAEGLAAAHRIGIVHRDVKPANVLVGADGRVRVVDFGLARTDRSTTIEGHPESPGSSMVAEATAGVAEGTPAYMAPEQILGQPPRPSSDQFAFCVSLWEGLWGERPFEAPTLPERLARIQAGPPQPPRRVRMPARLVRAMVRGLAADPAARFASMDDLLLELTALRRRDRIVKVVVLSAGVSAVAAAAIAVVATTGLMAAETSSCAGADAIDAVWNEARAAAITEAFEITEHPVRAATARRVREVLEGRASRWRQIHGEACRATRVGGEASEATLGLRLGCLEAQLGELRSLLGVLVTADRGVVSTAIDAVFSLPVADRCLEGAGGFATPTDPAAREAVQRLRPRLDQAVALLRVGRTQASVEVSGPVLAEARAIGWDRLTAEAVYANADALDLLGQDDAALAGFAESLRLSAGTQDASGAARAAAGLLFLHADGFADPPTARALAPAIEAIAALANGDDERGLVENALAATALTAGAAPEAVVRFERSIELRSRALGTDHPEIAKLYNNLSVARRQAGDTPGAHAALDRAQSIYERTYPAEHPSLGDLWSARAVLASAADDQDLAVELETRALEARRHAFGDDHVRVAESLNNIGGYHIAAGRRHDALGYMRRAVEILERTLGHDHLSLAKASINLAEALLGAGETDEALVLAERAVDVIARFPSRHRDLADALLVLAMTLDALGEDHQRTRATAARAMREYEAANALDVPWVADARALADGRSLRR